MRRPVNPPAVTSASELIARFARLCADDPRIVAAFVGGSHARGDADEHSDVDLYAVVDDGAYDGLVAELPALVRRLGEPIFCEPWRSRHGIDTVFFVLSNGTEGELGVAPASAFSRLHVGEHRVLVDKRDLLAGVAFPRTSSDQTETLRGLIEWFWHNVSHFHKAIARGQPWWAYGALDDMRGTCVQLIRLRGDFGAEPDGWEKVDGAVATEALAPLRPTLAADHADLVRAGRATIAVYQELARDLAREHRLRYPSEHAHVMLERLARLG